MGALVLNNNDLAPVPWWEWGRLFYDESLAFEDWHAVHFWNAMIAANGLDKNSRFPVNAPYERLKRAYLV